MWYTESLIVKLFIDDASTVKVINSNDKDKDKHDDV
jgi:hypothetical protein